MRTSIHLRRLAVVLSPALVVAVLLGTTTSPASADARRPVHATEHGSKHGSKHDSKHGHQARTGAVRGTLVSLPPITQPGRTPAAPERDGSIVATFSPVDPGQRVVLERRTARGWKVVDSAAEDVGGAATFAAPAPGTYRARTTTLDRSWVTGSVTTAAWTPTFEDTFDGTELDASVWNDQKREHESVYAPRTCARVDPAARRVRGGVLELGVAADPARLGLPCSYTTSRSSGTSPYVLNSQVATELTRSFDHGIFAARIKPQRARGMHSGFWMLPQGTTYVDGNPAGGTEIDVMEFFGESTRGAESIGSHVHYYESGWNKVTLGDTFRATRQALGRGRNWWDEFHVFSVEWTPTEYVFRVDGREHYREHRAVSQAQQYLVLSMLTSDYELGDLTADEMGDTAQVDWVRVFDAASTTASRTTHGRRSVRRPSRN